jgi:hypothetical protein
MRTRQVMLRGGGSWGPFNDFMLTHDDDLMMP